MSEDANACADGGERVGRSLTLQSALTDLSRLADDLAEVARLFDQATPGAASTQPTIETMTPNQFFSSLLELRRMRERHFRIEALGGGALDIALQLMLARIDEREPKLSELSGNSSSPPDATRRRAEQLIAAGLADRFENVIEPDDFHLSLSGEAALRLAELYRARTRG